jgi:serine/threonine protein kinase/Tol biopolymer transport system component
MTIPATLAAALTDRYRIEREIGSGGMATVYLAQDLRHDRRVAMKVLRPELAAVIGADRFLREIKTIANLQHPHILGLIDSGEVGGTAFYVMPYVEGQSLRDRLNHERQLPVDEAVRIATEVGGALDYAHRHGVIHRDIKPENVMLHDGSALVTDFGIALAVSTAGSTRMTETGMSLGTPHYMSPEQAMGEREITARSDVYALGATLYEMLVGEPPFTGPTAQSIVAKVLTEEPRPLLPRRHTIPANVEAAVFRALEKLPADRFASAAEMAAALRDPGFLGRTQQTTVIRRERGRPWLLPAVAVIALLAGAGLAMALRPERPAPVSRYGLYFPAGTAPNPGWRAMPSPDGSRLLYVGTDGTRPQLWVKPRDEYAGKPLAGTSGVTNFAWSPDGLWIAYTSSRRLWKIPVVGGAAIEIGDSASGAPGIAWLEDGTIVYVRQLGAGLRRVSAGGGRAETVMPDSIGVLFPSPLPGNRGILFVRCGANCNSGQSLWVLDLESGAAREVIPGAVWGEYVRTGHIVFVRNDGAMFAIPFDRGSLAVRGSPVSLGDSVVVLNGVYPLIGLSQSGTMVKQVGTPLDMLQRLEMVWVDRTGRESQVDSGWSFRAIEFGSNNGWALSRDGTRLAIGMSTEAGDDIWVKRLPRGPLSRVSFDGASEYRPRWMPDDRTLMFGSNRISPVANALYSRRGDGTGSDSVIVRAENAGIFEAAWAPDRSWLLFRTGGTLAQVGGRDIVGIRPGLDTVPVPVVVTPYDEASFSISPDGRWLAYESNETGRTEVFVRPFPNTDEGKWQVSNGGGIAPLWARNGRELFYVNAGRDMMAVPFTSGVEPGIGNGIRLFHLRNELALGSNENYTPHDVAPDGRFIMARQVPLPAGLEAPIVVVENWLEELKRVVGK